ncbi:MAG: hypothetical protein J2P17_03340 [Mycobacterium sp.]|nr:hypothetical protein [Mycobacterium sp.]
MAIPAASARDCTVKHEISAFWQQNRGKVLSNSAAARAALPDASIRRALHEGYLFGCHK